MTKLRPETRLTKALADAVETAFGQSFIELMEAEIDRRVKEYTDKLESRVDHAVTQRLDRLTNEAIQKRVDAAVNAARAAL